MKTPRSQAKHPIDGRREDVLAGMLLHVVEAPRPVDRPTDRLPRRHLPAACVAFVEHVRHAAIVFVENIDDVQGAAIAKKRAQIERLAA